MGGIITKPTKRAPLVVLLRRRPVGGTIKRIKRQKRGVLKHCPVGETSEVMKIPDRECPRAAK